MSVFACVHECIVDDNQHVIFYLHVNAVYMHLHEVALRTDNTYIRYRQGVLSISQQTCYYSVDRFITICPMTSASYF